MTETVPSSENSKVLVTDVSPDRRDRALCKAKWLVAQVQGSSALEGHGLPQDVIDSMIERTAAFLLSSGRI